MYLVLPLQLTGSNAVKVILLGDSAVGKSKCVRNACMACILWHVGIHAFTARHQAPFITLFFRLVERFLLDNYKPHQLSTYALTLYRHDFECADKTVVPIGENAITAQPAFLSRLMVLTCILLA